MSELTKAWVEEQGTGEIWIEQFMPTTDVEAWIKWVKRHYGLKALLEPENTWQSRGGALVTIKTSEV